MKNNIFITNYKTENDIKIIQKQIKALKDYFETALADNLELTRVSAPLFVDPETGLNDNLNGVEQAVGFNLKDGQHLEIVQSLAKWKRYALKKYNLRGLYTDMNAIRPDEDLDNLHSLYVDQWDWEKVIDEKMRDIDLLKAFVEGIYKAIKDTDKYMVDNFNTRDHHLPDRITFITTQELLDKYPTLSSKERENAIIREKKAVFIVGIGNKLSNGLPHDSRAADYDDWSLNGDLLLYHETLDIALEISSMGIRVNKDSLLKQLKEKNEEYKLKFDYHQNIINNLLPLTIGGGIGQSRLCMYFLDKAHIGEVQSSYWSKEDIEEFKKYNIILL